MIESSRTTTSRPISTSRRITAVEGPPGGFDTYVRGGSPEAWHGRRYWYAATPYPGGKSEFENPSVFRNTHGGWIPPAGVANPLARPEPVAYLSDHSPSSVGPGPDGLGERHEAALALADGADVLIHDAQHPQSEFPGVGYLGHASAEYAVALGREAGVRTVVLFHHAPTRTDEQIDAILQSVQGCGVPVLAAYEGLVLDLDDLQS